MAGLRTILGAVAFTILAEAAGASSGAFDARALDRDERRFLQFALSLTGHYAEMIDGTWDDDSDEALERYFDDLGHRGAIAFPDLRALLEETAREISDQGWEAFNFDLPEHTIFLPAALLRHAADEEYLTYVAPDRALLLRYLVDDRAGMLARHDWLVEADTRADGGWRVRSGPMTITRARLDSGKHATLFSMPWQAVYQSILVQYDDSQFLRGWTIENTVRLGHQDFPVPPAGGVLDAVARGMARGGGTAAPSTTAPGTRVEGSGTGFFVNATDIVTAAHVIDGCAAIRLTDGTALTRVASDPELDLAVVSAATRSPVFLPLDIAETPRLGEDVFALGYPNRGRIGAGLSVTGGNVSTLPHPDDPGRTMILTAPIQPGNSGGPVLNRAGEVIGVVVAKMDDDVYREATGTLPQNLNFAVSIPPLLAFLDTARVLYPVGTGQSVAPGEGIPQATQDSVVQIECLAR